MEVILFYSFLYVIIFTFAAVLIQKLYFTVSPVFSLLVTGTIATIYFNVINIGKLKTVYAQCWQHKKLWFAIMLTILVMWNCSMNGPGLIGASLYNFLYFAWLGMLGYLSLGFQNWKTNHLKFYFGVFIFLLIAALSIHYLYVHKPSLKLVIGILLALIGGTSSFVYFKQSKTITDSAKLSATQILSVRFYLTVVLMLILIPKHAVLSYVTPFNMGLLVLLAFLSLIIPLYCLQKALEKITAEQNAIIISLAPTTIAILQELVFKDVDFRYLVLYLLYTLVLVASYFVTNNKSAKVKNQ